MTVGVGITTYKRPLYFKDCIGSVLKHLKVDKIAVYNDGSKRRDYQSTYNKLPADIKIKHANKNKGVAIAKNWLLKYLSDCDYIFLLEDDIIIKSPKAVTGYIEVSKKTGIGHLMFAHHGPLNKGQLIDTIDDYIELYPHCVGAWCMYTKEAIKEVGYMDTNFHNAWEHIEHTDRLHKAGFTTPFRYFADAKGSDDWLAEQPGAIENTSIKHTKEWAEAMIGGLLYWAEKDPQFPMRPELDDYMRKAGVK